MFKKVIFSVLVLSLALLAACGASEPTAAEMIVGKWGGVLENAEGDQFPATFEFTEDGRNIVVIAPDSLNVVQTSTYWFDDDGALRLLADDAEEGTEAGRRELEFIGTDTVRMTAVNAGIVTTLTRIED